MSGTPNFMELWRSGIRSLAVLMDVALRDPNTLAYSVVSRFGSQETFTPAGLESGAQPQRWSPQILEVQPIQAPGSFGETSVQLCSCGVTLEAGALPFGYVLNGSPVSIYLWDTRLTDWDDVLPVFYGVVIRAAYDSTKIVLDLRQRTDWNRDVTPLEITTDKYPHAPDDSIGQRVPIVYGKLRDVPMRYPWAEYPAAQTNFGLSGTTFHAASKLTGARRAGSAIIVDTGRGSGAANNPAAKVLVASHKVAAVGDHSKGAGVYMSIGGQLVAVDVITPGTDIINTLTEAGILIRDNTGVGWMPVLPNDVDPVANTAENFRAVLDPWNDGSYARFDFPNGLKTLRCKFPSIEDPGDLVIGGMYGWISYRLPFAGTGFTLRLRNTTNSVTPIDAVLPQATSRRFVMGDFTGAGWNQWTGVATPAPTQPWAFGEVELEIGWPTTVPVRTAAGPAGQQIAEVYAVGFVCNFRPRQDVLKTERVVSHAGTRPVASGGTTVFMPYTVQETLPAVTELRGKFYSNVDGWQDDGAGSFAAEDLFLDWGTGTAPSTTVNFADAPQLTKDRLLRLTAGDMVVGANGFYPIGCTVVSYNPSTFVLTLSAPSTPPVPPAHGVQLTIRLRSQVIERAPDILAHMLVKYGGESLGNIEQALGAYGSFTDARLSLKDHNAQDMRYAFSVDATTDVMTAISWLAEGAFALPFIDRFTDMWRMVPWRMDRPVDYAWAFRPGDVIERTGLAVEHTPMSHLLTGLQVGYSYSALTTNTIHKNRLGWDGSNAGQKFRGVRDARILVDSTNDKFSWNVSGFGVVNATLTHGDYDPLSFATMLDGIMLAAAGAYTPVVVYGANIVANYNDQIQYTDTAAAITRTLTLTPGYYTFEGLTAHVASIINAANGGTFTTNCTFSRTTRKWTFERLGSTMVLIGIGGGVRHRRFLATIGFDCTAGNKTTNGTCNVTGEYERDDDRFVVGTIVTAYLNLLWETGASGLNGTRTDCHAVLGFEGLRDTIGQGTTPQFPYHMGDSPKGQQELALLKTAQRYGARRDTILDSRVIQSSDTARAMRDFVADAIGRPRVMVTFSTDLAPDIQRGRVIEFTAEHDVVIPFPDPDSDGSWAGKRFVVVETEQHLGPIAFYTKVSAVSLD